MSEKPVLKNHNVEKRGSAWCSRYVCFCGMEFIARNDNVNSGATSSCGCVRQQKSRLRISTHGLSNSIPRLHSIWCSMVKRCRVTTVSEPNYYRDSGITVCSQWLSYPNFYEWATSNGYSPSLKLARIDTKGNYEGLKAPCF